MIIIPKEFQNNFLMDKKFIQLVEFFNKLEQDLQNPSCDYGKTDQISKLEQAQNELIMWGIL